MQRNGIRMLAAVMFTDMVGYTAMMQEDEEHANSLRNRHRKVLEDLTLDHQGRILQYFGDGTLTIFGSAVEAVLCAMKVQIELQKDPKVNLRIGIHSGDIVYDDNGIFGDCVNIASRIEASAVGGSILISRKVYDELSNHKEISAVSLGYHEFKNVKNPIEVYAIKNEHLNIPESTSLETLVGLKKESIAVLPFINMSSDADNEYFSDGMTEEILNALAKVDKLHVTSRTSSFAFKGKNVDIREIGKQLAVKTVLEGSVRKVGNRVRVTAQLIETKSGYHKWSETYERDIEDIFAVQDEIARTISKNLAENLTSADQKKTLVKSSTRNMEAYNLYLKSSHFWKKWTPLDIRKSMEYLEQAIQLDENFAKAYSALSGCYVYLGAFGQMPATIAYPKAKEYANKALQLDHSLPESHLSIAMVEFFDWNWDAAYKSFFKTLELNPNSAEAHQYFAYYMFAIGNNKKAVSESEKALEIDPLSITINTSLAETYAHCGMFDQSKQQFLKTLELDHNFRAALNGLGWTHYFLGECELAIKRLKQSQDLLGDPLKSNAALGYIYAKLGMKSELENCLKKLEERAKNEKDVSFLFDYAIINMGMKNYDKAFEYLDLAFEQKIGGLIFIRGRYWKEIQDDKRFKKLILKMNLPYN
ncbi:MAG TPA: adenylate/guanylate cyclase domain-containing protein [Ignavibacteriaceae bacterium]